MASSSTSQVMKTYDVFISFRGADVRNEFLSYLQDALDRNGFKAFVDDNLERGEEIEESLLEKIKDSYVSIVIFSENYAFSPWCLVELVKILECMETKDQIVIPVFYRIIPDHVQELTGKYGEALAQHGREFKSSVESWSHALKKISSLSGLVSENVRPESKLVDEIVNHTSQRLIEKGPSISYNEELVDMKSRVERVKSLLSVGSQNVRVVGICGKAGIGKSIIAKKVYDQVKGEFKSRCVVEKISERLEKGTSSSVLNEILCAVLGPQVLNEGNNISLSSPIVQRLGRREVFIVLDGVSDLGQIEFLTGKHDILGSGSRVIVTSRNKQLLKNVSAEICEVEPLDESEALRLFCLHAFKQDVPEKGYKELSNMVVRIAKGNPQALKSIAFELCSKSVEDWEEMLKKFRGKYGNKIVKVIRKSNSESEEQAKMTLTKFGGPKLTATLDVLTLKDLKGCDNIPPLEQLYCLREIYLDNLIDLEHVDFAKDNEDGPFFPSLRKVWIWNCPNFKGWRKQVEDEDDDDDNDATTMPWFPCLSLLEIKNCPKLNWMPLFPSVDDRLYYINSGCQPLQQTMKLKRISKVKELWISELPDLEYVDLDEDYYFSEGNSGAKMVFKVLKKLWIYDCPNLKGWWKRRDDKSTTPAVEKLPQFPCLYLLEIRRCPKLSWMPLFPFLDQKLFYVKTGIQPLLRTLELSSFSNLEELWLSELSDLLYIHGDQRGSSSSSSTAFLSLKKLWIDYCQNFEGWWTNLTTFRQLPEFQCLSLIEIKHCPKLSCMPLFPSINERLYYVNVGIEPLLQTMKTETSPFINLKELWLSELTDLEYLDSQRQEESRTRVLPCLDKLWISYCPNLRGWWKKSDDDDPTPQPLPQFPRISTYDIKDCPLLKNV